MPNGGIPMHMRLQPSSSSSHVVVCHGAELQLFTKEDWRQDGQPAVAIVVVAKRPEYPHGVILGTFTMDGIRSAPTCVPKIEVTLKLLNEKTLHASALYRNGKRTKALTFRAAKQAPNLRAVATADDIPEDDY